MFGYSVDVASGRVAVGEEDYVFTPRSPRIGTCGVILLHGAGGSATKAFIDPVFRPNHTKIAAALARAGIPCIAGDFGGDAWAGDTHMARIDSAWSVLKDLFPAMRTDKVCLFGHSMGSAAGARWSQLHPESVAAFVASLPLMDLRAFYSAADAGVQSQIGSQWGVTPPAALPASADIAGNAAVAAGIPTLFGYSTVDAVTLPQWAFAYADVVGAETMVIDTTAGHSDVSLGGFPVGTIGKFLAAHGA